LQRDNPDLRHAAPVEEDRPATPEHKGAPLQTGIEKWYQEEWSAAPPGNPAPNTTMNYVALGALLLVLIIALCVRT
jgi:hypothetical protein